MRPVYHVKRAPAAPEGQGLWNGAVWSAAEPAAITAYHEQSSDHHPVVEARCLYDDRFLHLLFRVQADRAVKVIAQDYQGDVWLDSCVEFFVMPKPDLGYFNFEVNAGGCVLLHYTDKDKKQIVPKDLLCGMQVHHSLPERIDPEIEGPIDWTIEYSIPLSLFEHYTGPLGPLSGQTWRGNFYKCADESSLPHWGMWSPVGKILSFHQPAMFGDLCFE